MSKRMIFWPVPDPVLPAGVDPVLAEVTRSATAAFRHARERFDREELVEKTQIPTNGTIATRLVDLAPALVLLPAAGGSVIDAFGRPIEVANDLSRRWSGVVAASPALAEELAAVISGA